MKSPYYHGLLGDARDLGDGAHGSSFAQALQDALRDGKQQRGRLTLLSSREAPAPRVEVHADIVTECNGVVIRDRRRVH
jgi:hypothetical protein